ncbi:MULTISPECIES: hypothetical protein [unclassified Sphingomonas]|uniref:hypothetical protein n=1 Tax=unclassified Sphingomonas TaxID=196159 RepID=UPI0025F984C4|nr:MULTISPECIES: hypothetical protein [unclassified Sphingomonas]
MTVRTVVSFGLALVIVSVRLRARKGADEFDEYRVVLHAALASALAGASVSEVPAPAFLPLPLLTRLIRDGASSLEL